MSYPTISRIVLRNYRRFQNLDLNLSSETNLIIGDNEAGKSSVLEAIDLVLSGTRSRIENVGLVGLLNKKTVDDFNGLENRTIADLPQLSVEVCFRGLDNHRFKGENNSFAENAVGIKLVILPDQNLQAEIELVLKEEGGNFPYEFYKVKFSTFSGEGYSGHSRPNSFIHINNTAGNSEYTASMYVKTLYEGHAKPSVVSRHQNRYRNLQKEFSQEILKEVSEDTDDYTFAIKSSKRDGLKSSLTIEEDGMPIENRGSGMKSFIKTDLAIRKSAERGGTDLVLLEEPENHLSHSNMRKLVDEVVVNSGSQVILTTHSSMVASRLDLRKAILLNSRGETPFDFGDLSKSASEFFMKSPDNRILELVLSDKVILVEGHAEYILIETLYQAQTARSLNADNIHVIAVGGTGKIFSYYLELAQKIGIKVAVVRDNDGDKKANCIDMYTEFDVAEKIKVFYDDSEELTTFEESFYNSNVALCEKVFGKRRDRSAIQKYMLNNKTEAAHALSQWLPSEVVVPDYIKNSFVWIIE